MDLPKCRTCGERHRLGGCPSNATKSKSNPFEDAARGRDAAPKTSRESPANPEQEVTRQHEHRPKTVSGRKSSGNQPASRETKPAKKAKPKKEKKNAASIDRKKNKVRKPDSKRRSKGHHRSELPGNDTDQPIATVDAGQDLSGSAGDIAQLAASPIRPGHPRKGEEHKTLTATKPWVALKMSRAGWYRNGKPMPEAKGLDREAE